MKKEEHHKRFNKFKDDADADICCYRAVTVCMCQTETLTKNYMINLRRHPVSTIKQP